MLQSILQPLGSGNVNSSEGLKWRKSRESDAVRLDLLGKLGKGICDKESKRDSPWCRRESKGLRLEGMRRE